MNSLAEDDLAKKAFHPAFLEYVERFGFRIDKEISKVFFFFFSNGPCLSLLFISYAAVSGFDLAQMVPVPGILRL
jgi:hypothetical protein